MIEVVFPFRKASSHSMLGYHESKMPLYNQQIVKRRWLSAIRWSVSLGNSQDDFLFLGPRHRFYLCFSNKSFGMRQAFLLI